MDHMEKDYQPSEDTEKQAMEEAAVIQCVASPILPEQMEAEPLAEPAQEAEKEAMGELSERAEETEVRAAASPDSGPAAEKKPFSGRLDAFLRRHRISRGMAAGMVLMGTTLLVAVALLLRTAFPPDAAVSAPDPSSLYAHAQISSSALSEPPKVSSGGAAASETISRLSATYEPGFAQGPVREQSGVYVIEEAAVKRRTLSTNGLYVSPEQLLYNPDMAASTRLYFEPDGMGGYMLCSPEQYTENKDAYGNVYIYRMTAAAQQVAPIVVAYHSCGGRYYFDSKASSSCYLLTASADGKKMVLFDISDVSAQPLLFEPNAHTLSPVTNISYPDAEPADTVWAEGCAMSTDGRFLAYLSNRRQQTSDWSGTQEQRAALYDLWVWDGQTGKESILKKDVSWAYPQWREHTLYWEQTQVFGKATTTKYFCAALPGGKVRELDDAEQGIPSGMEPLEFYNILQQHVVLRIPEENDSADFIQIWNLEKQQIFTYSFDQLEGVQLSLSGTPILSADGTYAICLLLGEERFESPALYLAAIRTDDGTSRLYRLPPSVPTSAELGEMLGDQVFLFHYDFSDEDLLSSTIRVNEEEVIQFSLAPLPAAGS